MKTLAQLLGTSSTPACVALGVGLGCLFAVQMNASATNSKGLFVADPIRQLGQIEQGSKHTVNFDLTNKSNQEISILKVGTSCDCTDTKINAMHLQAGETTKLGVIWDTTNKRHLVQSDIEIMYEQGGARESIKLNLFGDVLPAFEREPTRLVFASGSKERRAVKFTPRVPDASLKILKLTCPYKCINLLSDGHSSQFEAEFDPQFWSPDMSYMEVEIHLDAPGEPIVFVPIEIVAPRK